MMKTIFMALSLLVMVMFWNTAIQARFGSLDIQKSDVPVVAELYTSEGCSSCPPADRVLDELSQHENIITLGCHVTYWDRLGWKDTLGRNFCDERQRNYADHMRSNRVYTPQLIINGEIQFVGSHKGDVNKFVKQEIKANNVKAIALSTQGPKIQINLPALRKNGDYTLYAIGYKKHHTTNIGRGENGGRTIGYTNTALSLESLGSWGGERKTLMLPKPNQDDIDGLAIIAQSTSYGPIIAAGRIGF